MVMDKLIELLNEFLEENYPKKNLVKAIEDDYFVNNWNDGDGFLCETVMSKKFLFIKRLVESDKIDFSNLAIEEIVAGTDLYYIFNNYEVLLMLLSIQDDPIEFLVSILK